MIKQVKCAAAVLVLAMPAAVCAQQPAAAPSQSGPDEAARIGDRVITVRELDEAWSKSDPVEHTRATQMLYEGRKAVLDAIVAEALIQQAAKARGLAPDEFARQETAKRVKPVTDADVAQFYAQNQSRMQGKPLDDMRIAIRNFIEQQRQTAAREALVAELKESGPPIRLALDPPRREVPVAATDPARGGANAPVTLVEFSDYQ